MENSVLVEIIEGFIVDEESQRWFYRPNGNMDNVDTPFHAFLEDYNERTVSIHNEPTCLIDYPLVEIVGGEMNIESYRKIKKLTGLPCAHFWEVNDLLESGTHYLLAYTRSNAIFYQSSWEIISLCPIIVNLTPLQYLEIFGKRLQ